ncbi:Chromatin structure-remodeling complex subunit rsc9 [Lasiodiplodia hormozganensis]|uniref:Chromatin structure-remodeling complex subunit rsc9 n=1 Tax=Lasiodiplodia hormozganensis TaxID=869390 RepID=A0AA39YLJ1_9PEZI|nr:Chromatin structure-remodeling complex subunit rsc9 [Lasiodiplodia hormozganensis]
MAPARPRESSIERTPEYDDFMNKLEDYHAKRGTTLDREPKVGQRHLNLFHLYKRVCEEGGYDKVSDTKNNKLAWRRIAADFIPPDQNPTTQAFIVKKAYYKNLAAYEISNFHGKEPPPKEILEDVSAKGGDLLRRTKENFSASSNRELDSLTNGHDKDSDESDDEAQKTPKEDKMDIDGPPGSSGRVTRALRQAPPQRVLFQPESTSRQTRSSGQHNSPTPGSYSQSNGSFSGGGNTMSIISNYEPKPVVPSNVKPVMTPSNNPEHFRTVRSRMANRLARPVPQNKGMMLPGTGFTGPNIYIRALLALQSGSVEEQAYALHHLVKISHERGDKYRFDGFPGLAEALIGRLLDVSTLFYGFHWEICYNEDECLERNDALNAISGTANLLQKIHSHPLLDFTDDVQTKEFSEALGRVNEAGLVIRNLVMLDANAHYVSQLPLIQDFITIALNLPPRSSVIELKHYALEIAEQLSRYWLLTSEHHLYQTLLAQLDSSDRGTIITALRALSRIAMNANPRYELTNVPTRVIQHVCEWLLVEDEQLREACLDFLYLYTATTENVETLTQHTDVEGLVKQLVRLLLYNAQTIRLPVPTKASGKPSNTAPESAPKLAGSIIDQLLSLDEPDRSSQWLKTCFEEDPMGEITQIALWTAYNAAFQAPIQKLTAQQQSPSLPSTPGSSAPPATSTKPPKPMMAAKDFITNVSNTFPSAAAQVITAGGVQKYTIKGIRPRTVPVDLRNRPYIKCRWVSPPSFPSGSQAGGEECGEYVKEPKQIWEHILQTHLGLSKDSDGKWQIEEPATNGVSEESEANGKPKKLDCRWAGCLHFTRAGEEPTAFEVGRHVQTHLPDSSEKSQIRNQHNQSGNSAPDTGSLQQQYYGPFGPLRGNTRGDQTSEIKWLNTAMDERSVAQSLSGASAMVLRNLARRLSAVSAQGSKEASEDTDMEAGDGGWVRKVFAPVKDDLFFVMAHNQSLKEGIFDLLRDISSAGV